MGLIGEWIFSGGFIAEVPADFPSIRRARCSMTRVRCDEAPLLLEFYSVESYPMASATIKKQILDALSHPEAEDGLYFNNLIVVHEEEERPIVEGEESLVRSALEEMIREGAIVEVKTEAEVIYRLK